MTNRSDVDERLRVIDFIQDARIANAGAKRSAIREASSHRLDEVW
jgi:hypothetical protein